MRVGERARRGPRCRQTQRESSPSVRERRTVGRTIRAVRGLRRGLGVLRRMRILGARCGGCAAERRRDLHRRANRVYGRSPQGRATGRARQARFRAARRGLVTDAISTEESPSPTSSLPSSSTVEATRTEEVLPDESQDPKLPPSLGAARCARCGRALSGRVRPSERSPPRGGRRPRAPRLARGREVPS